MADLTQINGNQRIVMGWFGSCDDEGCEEYPLRTAEVVEAVDSIYEIHTDSTRAVAFHSYIYETLPNQTQSLESLKCGHSYYVALKAGDKTLTIEEFVIADESTTQERYVTVDDQCGGGGGGMATISFLPNSPSDNGDMRISIGADLTEINDLCSSNVWAYRIEKLANESDETGDRVGPTNTWGSGDSDSITVISGLVSPTSITNNSATGGDSWYKVYIRGYSSTNVSTGVTDEVSAKVFIAWPKPTLYVDTNECPNVTSDATQTEADNLTTCHVQNVSYLHMEGPSDLTVYDTADGPAIFSISRYLISFLKLSYHDPATAHLWEFSLDLGDEWWDVATKGIQDVTTVVNSHHMFDLYIRLKAKDSDNEDLAIGNYQGKFEFEYNGMEENPETYHSYITVNAEVKPRTVTIQTLTDNRDLQVGFTLTVNNVTHWQFKFSGPAIEDTSPIRTSTTGSIAGAAYPGTYTMEAWGVSEIDGEWKIVTPVDSKTVVVEWPDPKLVPTSTINEGYEEESGPSRGDDTLIVTHTWVTDYTFSMADFGDDAWEIKRSGPTGGDWHTVPVAETSYFSRNDQNSVESDATDVYILRLREGLPSNPDSTKYNRSLLLNGTAKNGDSITQWAIPLYGTVTAKPPCCNGMPNGNTFETTGYGNNNMNPTVSASGIKVRTIGFENGGKLCFSNGSEGMVPSIYLVDLYDEGGVKLVGGAGPSEPFGSVNVQGTFTGSKQVVYEDPLGNCYIGELSAISPARNQLHDPGRNEGPTLFGIE
jgi:hypothetical protein